MNSTTVRYHYMDSMRAILMMLGVVLHSSQVFNPEQTWKIYSDNSTWLAQLLVDSIHTFRMPAFFVISGYFCALTLKKYRVGPFLKLRIKRLLLPLMCTAITLNTAQYVLLSDSGWIDIQIEAYLTQGHWVSHLWFLLNLVIYFVFAALFVALSTTGGKRVFLALASFLERRSVILVILGLPLISLAILTLNKVGFPLYSEFAGFLSVFSLLKFTPYFIFGTLLFNSAKLLQKFTEQPPWIALLILVIASLGFHFIPRDSQGLDFVVFYYLEYLISWCAVQLCFYLFYNYFNRGSRVWAFLSDASYTVYLAHHFLVIAFGLLLIQLKVNAILGMMLLIATILVLTLALHKFVILKSGLLRMLYNGK